MQILSVHKMEGETGIMSILKYKIRMILFWIWIATAVTGCAKKEAVFLEETYDLETASEVESADSPENSEGAEASKNGTNVQKADACETGDNALAGSVSGDSCNSENGSEGTADLGEVSEGSRETEGQQTMYVDVCGAVVNPGVYELETGSRIFQAVDAAGGYLPEAAKNYLNRARNLVDGQQIYVPTEDEVTENIELMIAKAPEALQPQNTYEDSLAENSRGEVNSSGTGQGSEGEGHFQTDDRIDLNTADASQLSTLSGIGQSKAEAIIAYREAHGRFSSIEEIMNVEGIKEGTFSKIKDKISAG